MPLRKNAKIEMLRSVPLFSQCTKKELVLLASEAEELDVSEGKTLTKQGERGREFMVIVEGAADVRKNGRRVNRLQAGDFLGEIALVSGAPRTATVTATSDLRLLVLTDRGFRRVIEQAPSVQGSVIRALSERLQADAI